jgi:RimJ/RimL family protein N-acetyltransferase
VPEATDVVAITLEPCRPVESDAQRVMEWRNDPTTQAMFFRPGLKVWPGFFHEFTENYFTDRTLPPAFARRGSDVVAFIAFKRVSHPRQTNRSCVDISINVAPTRRGSGIGTAVLREIPAFLLDRNVDTVLAVIKEANVGSLRAFERAGFRLLDSMIRQVPETGESCAVRRYVMDIA